MIKGKSKPKYGGVMYYCNKCKRNHYRFSPVGISHYSAFGTHTFPKSKHPKKLKIEKYYCPICKRMHKKDSPVGKEHLKYVEIGKAQKLIDIQIKEDDWSHLSVNYPNIIGLTDDEIDKYIQNEFTSSEHDEIKNYIKSIKCYNKDDVMDTSKNMYEIFKNNGNSKWGSISTNVFDIDNTIFVTSPKGGPEILSNFAYANGLDKKNFPFDLVKSTMSGDNVLRSNALPYQSNYIEDVNDIVFIDDIFMSGEQERKAFVMLHQTLDEYNISPSQRPRLHYMALVGNKTRLKSNINKTYRISNDWDSVVIGDAHKFHYEYVNNEKVYKDISAVVFPFSVCDGPEHTEAFSLYQRNKKLKWRD